MAMTTQALPTPLPSPYPLLPVFPLVLSELGPSTLIVLEF